MKVIRILTGMISCVIFLGFLATPIHADEKVKSRTVDCDKGQHPADVLNQERGPQPLEMTLVGTCPGFTVARDDVTIEGDDEYGCPDASAKVEGTITFSGAQRAVVACLFVTGPGNGIDALPGSSVLIIDSSISDNTEAGVTATSGASISLSRSYVTDNQGEGVVLNTSASADVDNTEIYDNGMLDGAADLFMSLHTTATGQGNTIGAIHLRLDSGVSLDGSIGGPVSCADTESSALVNGDVPEGCTGFSTPES